MLCAIDWNLRGAALRVLDVGGDAGGRQRLRAAAACRRGCSASRRWCPAGSRPPCRWPCRWTSLVAGALALAWGGLVRLHAAVIAPAPPELLLLLLLLLLVAAEVVPLLDEEPPELPPPLLELQALRPRAAAAPSATIVTLDLRMQRRLSRRWDGRCAGRPTECCRARTYLLTPELHQRTQPSRDLTMKPDVTPVAHGPAARGRGTVRNRVGTHASEQRAQHVLHDAAVAVVLRLAGGVDAHPRVELDVAGRAPARCAGCRPR